MVALSGVAVAGLAVGSTFIGAAAASGAHPAAARTAEHQLVTTVRVAGLGRVLATSDDRVLYLFERDGRNQSHCNRTCRNIWPPLISKGRPRAGRDVAAAHLGRTSRDQVTYHGHPLYIYAGDDGPRQHRGEGLFEFGAKWYVVNAHGRAVK